MNLALCCAHKPTLTRHTRLLCWRCRSSRIVCKDMAQPRETDDLVAEFTAPLRRLANLGLRVVNVREVPEGGEQGRRFVSAECRIGGASAGEEAGDLFNQQFVTDNDTPTWWHRENGDESDWDKKRIRWTFVERLFTNARFLESLEVAESRAAAEREARRMAQDDPNLPLLETAFPLPAENCVGRLGDATGRDFVESIPEGHRHAITAGAVDTEGEPSAICCLLVRWGGDRHHHVVVWMRDSGAVPSLTRAMRHIADAMHPDFRWCSWGGAEARQFGSVEAQDLCNAEQETCLVDAYGMCVGTTFRKNMDAVLFWPLIDEGRIRMAVPDVDWDDNESVVGCVTTVVRQHPINICIADTHAILAVLEAVNGRAVDR